VKRSPTYIMMGMFFCTLFLNFLLKDANAWFGNSDGVAHATEKDATPFPGTEATAEELAPEAQEKGEVPEVEDLSSMNRWLKVSIGIIGTASDDILRAALERVTRDAFDGLVIVLDTPGGSLDATRAMVQRIMGAPVPVVVWIGPNGAHAGSAGAFITLAAHVAVMAPGTNIGAATPIDSSGKDIGGKEGSGTDDIKKKVMNDTVSFITSIAETRGRNAEMASSFVTAALSLTATEALENNVIDFIAEDLKQLFSQVEGRVVSLNGKKVRFPAVEDPELVNYELSVRQEILSILSNPNLFYLLFMAGLIGLGFELTHPGALFPGVIGGICLILALIATSVLPISYGAAALVLAGIGMLVAEAFLPSFGILGIGGVAAFLLGSVFLVDPSGQEGLRISWGAILPGGLAVIGTTLFLGFLILRTSRSRVRSGQEGITGKVGQVLRDFVAGEGPVRVEGEIWTAKCHYDLKKGQPVKVLASEGLMLIVTLAEQG
jgi:membrane-bound serine protease (ClpP class)